MVETGSTVDGVPNLNLNPPSEVCSAVVPKHKQKAKKTTGCSVFEERAGLAGGGSRGPRVVTDLEAWGIRFTEGIECRSQGKDLKR